MVLKKNDTKNRQDNNNGNHSSSTRGGTPVLHWRGITGFRTDSYVYFDIYTYIPDSDTGKQLEQPISALAEPTAGQRSAIPMGWSAARRAHAARWLARPAAEPG
jgi:hypothetical protein